MILHHAMDAFYPLLGLLALLAAACTSGCAAPIGHSPRRYGPGFHERSITIGDVTRRYVVYIPRNYREEVQTPTIMFLHGRGECGTDGWKPVGQGIGRAIMSDVDRWPFIVIFPQKADQNGLWEDDDALVMGTLAATARAFSVDASRTYLTGLSQGGHGTWAIAAKHPSTWAAIVPICGYADPIALAPAVKHFPIWCFHGAADKVILVDQSRNMVNAIRVSGKTELKYTEFAAVEHNSWDMAYGTADLPEWLLRHSLAKPAKPAHATGH
jgi:dienelactone hydrolase